MDTNDENGGDFRDFIRKKKAIAKTNYQFKVRSLVETQKSVVDWDLAFRQPIEYFMYPSLNVIPAPERPNSSHDSHSQKARVEVVSSSVSKDGEGEEGEVFQTFKPMVREEEEDTPAPDPMKHALKWKAHITEVSKLSLPSTKRLSTANKRTLLEPGSFDYDVQVRGEQYLRDHVRDSYEAKVEAERVAKAQARIRQRNIEKFGNAQVERDEKIEAVRASRRGGGVSANPSRQSALLMAELNSPEVLYANLRADGQKKKTISNMFGQVLMDQNLEEEVYIRQKTMITELVGTADYSTEGLLYYRFRDEMERERQQALMNMEPMAMRPVPAQTLESDSTELSAHLSLQRSIGNETMAQGSPLKILRAHRGAHRSYGQLESDTSTLNLSNLQRAIHALNMTSSESRLDGIDLDFEIRSSPLAPLPIVRRSENGAPISPIDSPHGMSGLITADSAVSVSTRWAQDKLMIAQLEAGKLPEAFIKRSSNLKHAYIDIPAYGIGNTHGICLGKAIKGFDTLQRMNLNDNRLSGSSVSVIMSNAASMSLHQLILSSNMLRDAGARSVAAYLSHENVLKQLELANCGLQCEDLTAICRALAKGVCAHLVDLDVSRNRIGVEGATAIAQILRHPTTPSTLKNINLAWNDVGAQGAIALAVALVHNQVLTHLNLSGNAISDQAGQRLADSLLTNETIIELNLSQNLIGGCSCFVFAKAVKKHPAIMKLDLSRNPLGEAGARSFYRTILRGLRCFVIMRSCSYFEDDKIFNYSTPSVDSPYNLNLEEPYKRSVLIELMTMATEDPISCRFGAVTWSDGKPGSQDQQLTIGVKDGEVINKITGKKWKPPKVGRLLVHFYSSVAIPTLERAATSTTMNIIQAIVIGAREEDRVDYLRLLCIDVYCTTTQAQAMILKFVQHRILGSGGLRQIDVVSCIWSRLIDAKNMYDFLCTNVPPQERRELINVLTIEEFKFTWGNPSGHWRLNLEKATQRIVMNKIIAINAVEAAFSRRKSGRGDTSQEGNWFNFRNGRYMSSSKSNKEVLIDQTFVDNLPKYGTIAFDYVSTTRPGHAVEIIADAEGEGDQSSDAPHVDGEGECESVDVLEMGTDETHTGHEVKRPTTGNTGSKPSTVDDNANATISDDDFVALLAKLRLSSRMKIHREKNLFYLMELQLAVTKYFFTIANALQIMDCFSSDTISQAKVIVALFSRIHDLYNMDILLKTLPPAAQREVLLRLGCLNVLNPLKLAFDYYISMKHLDERILLTLLLEISPLEGTDQIIESPKTDVSVITFYGALHRIVSSVRDDRLIFTYCEVGEKTMIVAWGTRRDALRKFLIGTRPLVPGLFRIVGMYNEMHRHGTLTRGPIELQYNSHLKAMASIRKQELNRKVTMLTKEALRSKDTSNGAGGAVGAQSNE